MPAGLTLGYGTPEGHAIHRTTPSRHSQQILDSIGSFARGLEIRQLIPAPKARIFEGEILEAPRPNPAEPGDGGSSRLGAIGDPWIRIERERSGVCAGWEQHVKLPRLETPTEPSPYCFTTAFAVRTITDERPRGWSGLFDESSYAIREMSLGVYARRGI